MLLLKKIKLWESLIGRLDNLSQIIKFLIKLFVVLFYTANVNAYKINNMTLIEKIEKSDVIFIGTVTHVSKESDFATIMVDELLYGNVENDFISVKYKMMIAEFNPDCCVLDSTYLFFVIKRNKEGYQSVNARFGIINIKDRLGAILKERLEKTLETMEETPSLSKETMVSPITFDLDTH